MGLFGRLISVMAQSMVSMIMVSPASPTTVASVETDVPVVQQVVMHDSQADEAITTDNVSAPVVADIAADDAVTEQMAIADTVVDETDAPVVTLDAPAPRHSSAGTASTRRVVHVDLTQTPEQVASDVDAYYNTLSVEQKTVAEADFDQLLREIQF